jgi:pimeloyl-ACP methyl ester carboxylesterase
MTGTLGPRIRPPWRPAATDDAGAPVTGTFRRQAARVTPAFTEVGDGPGIVCLHASGSHAPQWRAFAERMAPQYHVLAADSYGSGRSPAWPANEPLTLRDEVAFLEPVFARAGEPFSLVAHSYGAATALIAAIDRPERVRALAVYEPTIFSLVDAATPPPNDVDGIYEVEAVALVALAAGCTEAAAECFVDYWMGPGAWDAMPESRREAVAIAAANNIRGWVDAVTYEPTPLEAFRDLDVPVLLMSGKRSPKSSRAVARLLAETLPHATVIEFEHLGHMAPVTHPDIVNEVIADFLARH